MCLTARASNIVWEAKTNHHTLITIQSTKAVVCFNSSKNNSRQVQLLQSRRTDTMNKSANFLDADTSTLDTKLRIVHVSKRFIK